MSVWRSSRKDRKGHWTPGKPRHNVDPQQLQRVMDDLLVILETKWQYGKTSINRLAKDIGVHETTLRRWVYGDYLPSQKHLDKLEQWTQANKS